VASPGSGQFVAQALLTGPAPAAAQSLSFGNLSTTLATRLKDPFGSRSLPAGKSELLSPAPQATQKAWLAPARDDARQLLSAPPSLARRAANEWGEYMLRRRESKDPDPVVKAAEARALFAELFNIGKLWWSPTRWGPRVSAAALEDPARRAVSRFFSATPELRSAADAFVDRALDPATGKSSNQRRKLLLDTILAASVQSPQNARRLFGDRAREPLENQTERQEFSSSVVRKFSAAAEAILVREAARDPRFNVVGVIMAGSYVAGTARPGSDLDFVVLTRDGSSADVRNFLQELSAAQPPEGWPPAPDWQRFFNVMRADGSARDFMKERPTRLVSPLPEVRSLAPQGRRLEDGRPWDGLIHKATAPLLRLWVRLRLAASGSSEADAAAAP
jgi:predicted nucleotidyltransferase